MATREIALLLQNYIQELAVSLNDNDQVIIIPDDWYETKTELEDLGVEFEEFAGDNEIRLSLNDIDRNLYFDNEDYFNKNKTRSLEILGQNIFIINSHVGFIEYNNGTVLNNELNEIEDYLIQNLAYHNGILDLLVHSPQSFVYHHDSVKKKFFIGTAENPNFIIGYQKPVKSINHTSSFENAFNELSTQVNRLDYVPHLKESIVNALASTDVNDRLAGLINNYEEIRKKADFNYELYLKKFSFEKLKNELRIQKEKYFESTREILSKLMGKIITIPISVSAAVFAIYRIKDNPVFSFFVLASFLIYSSFTYYLLNLIKHENKEIKDDFESDYITIEEESGLSERELRSYKFSIERRISALSLTIKILKLILISLSGSILYIWMNSASLDSGISTVILICSILTLNILVLFK